MNAAVALALLLAATAGAGPDRRPPIDQCTTDPSLAAFRDGLRAAVERRDRDALLAAVTDATLVDYGGGVGRADFIASWRLDDPATSPIWEELGTALSLGCARDQDGSYWAPSLAIQLADQDDIFMTFIALPGAELHATPDPASPVAASLEWDVLTLIEDDSRDDWLEVDVAGGGHGFVRRDRARAMLDYRAVFERVDGRWVLAAFIAGD